MAKIKEEMLIVKVSTLVKDSGGKDTTVFSDDVVATLEDAISEMVGSGHVVEIIKE
jgi:hypothetical protein